MAAAVATSNPLGLLNSIHTGATTATSASALDFSHRCRSAHQQPPMTVVMTMGRGGAGGGGGGGAAAQGAYISPARAMGRITSLEKTVEFLQDEHLKALKGLHAEVARLQNTCADLTLKLVIKTDTDAKNGTVAVVKPPKKCVPSSMGVPDNPSPPSQTITAQLPLSHVDSSPSSSSSSTSPPPDAPIYILLTQQKQKYLALIDRMNEDNKRKQVEIDHLKTEIELIREVLALGGMQLQMNELRALACSGKASGGGTGGDVMTKLKGRLRKKVAPVLPPIGAAARDREDGFESVGAAAAAGGVETDGGRDAAVPAVRKPVKSFTTRIPGPKPPPEDPKQTSPRGRMVKYNGVAENGDPHLHPSHDEISILRYDETAGGGPGDPRMLGLIHQAAPDGTRHHHHQPQHPHRTTNPHRRVTSMDSDTARSETSTGTVSRHFIPTAPQPVARAVGLHHRSVSGAHSTMSGDSSATLEGSEVGHDHDHDHHDHDHDHERIDDHRYEGYEIETDALGRSPLPPISPSETLSIPDLEQASSLSGSQVTLLTSAPVKMTDHRGNGKGVGAAAPPGKPATKWTRRVQGVKAVREKNWRDMKERM